MRRPVRLPLLLALVLALPLAAQTPAPVPYFPPRDDWQQRKPSDVGMDDALLADAVAYAQTQETTTPKDFSTQEATFGRPLGPVPQIASRRQRHHPPPRLHRRRVTPAVSCR